MKTFIIIAKVNQLSSESESEFAARLKSAANCEGLSHFPDGEVQTITVATEDSPEVTVGCPE
jgi:hypothetical protein